MDKETVLEYFRSSGALLEGHFILSSGLRSANYLQCARVLMNPERAAVLCKALSEKINAGLNGEKIDLVVSPAMGGVIVGYEMARQLGVDGVFTERVEGGLHLRRGFEIPEGARVLMAEDIVTTGLSSRECLATIESHGGRVVAASCLVDRSNGTVDLDVPLYSLVGLDIPTYKPEDVPAELAKIEPIKPGSRGQKK